MPFDLIWRSSTLFSHIISHAMHLFFLLVTLSGKIIMTKPKQVDIQAHSDGRHQTVTEREELQQQIALLILCQQPVHRASCSYQCTACQRHF